MEPIPGPDDPFYDVGELVPDEPETPAPGDAEPAESSSPPLEDAGPVTPDEPPAHAKRGWRRQARQARPQPKPPRITNAIRTDIDAKISLMLEIPGRVWEARDPVCGGTFVQQRPDISAAFTDIVCQSPDLVAWFTGTGGQFMLWLNLAAACWPVAGIVMAHHVYHTVELAPADAEPQPDVRYAA